MKKALRRLLPRDILHRHEARLRRADGRLAEGRAGRRCCDGAAVAEQSLQARGLLRHEPVAALIDDHRANRVDGTDQLLALLNLEIWCRVYLDRRSPSDVADELERGRRMRILYVCHRFPYPPKRGGKIRPFNMIRHLAQHARGDGVLAGALGRARPQEAQGIAPHCAEFDMAQVDEPHAERCAWSRRLPTPITVVDVRSSISPELARTMRRLLRERDVRPDLRALLVGGAVRRARARHAEDPRLRRHGLAEVARVRAATSRSRCRWATGWKASEMLAPREAPGAALRLLHGDHARRMADARGLRHRRATGLVSQRRRQRVLRTDRRAPTTPTRSSSSAGWTTTRTSSACSTSAPSVLPLLRAQRPTREAADRRRRSVAGGARARRDAGRHGHRLGARRAAVTSARRR